MLLNDSSEANYVGPPVLCLIPNARSSSHSVMSTVKHGEGIAYAVHPSADAMAFTAPEISGEPCNNQRFSRMTINQLAPGFWFVKHWLFMGVQRQLIALCQHTLGFLDFYRVRQILLPYSGITLADAAQVC